MQRDDQPRAVAIPPVIKKALAKEPRAQAIFAKLPPSHRREYVKWITEAKKEETINRRLAKLIPKLLEKFGSKS
jgi:uncharacterized protein YdeI (YjbR/CyaY-like superfamily)